MGGVGFRVALDQRRYQRQIARFVRLHPRWAEHLVPVQSYQQIVYPLLDRRSLDVGCGYHDLGG